MDATSSLSPVPPAWLPIVETKLRHVRFGVVPLVVHDGKVTQIECTEKLRLPSMAATHD
jgi:hypothetical protein